MPIKQKDLAPRKAGRAIAVRENGARGLYPSEDAFADPRSGHDRRTVTGGTLDSRRTGVERRRNRPAAPWWLCRNYLESHRVPAMPTPPECPEPE